MAIAKTHNIDKAALMRNAWKIAKRAKYETARRKYFAQFSGVSITFKGLSQAGMLALTPIDLSAALKLAWFSAKQPASVQADAIRAAVASIISRIAA